MTWQLSTNSNTLLPYDPAVLLLVTYPREIKTYVPREIWIQMFPAAVFTMAPN